MVDEIEKRFVAVKLDTDTGPRAKEYQRLQEERFNQPARPLYVILTSDGLVELARDGGSHTAESFLEFLGSVP